jgi:hypothetical protein
MIYEYAVDPSLFTAEDKVCFLLESFGRDNGRLISEIKKDHWVNLVRAAIQASGQRPVAKHTLKEALKILTKKNKALYCRQQQIEEDPSWFSMTQQAHSMWPYRGIVLEEYDGDEPHYIVRDIHLSSKSNWGAPTSLTVDREATAMVAAMAAMLVNAREVILVDRNFRFENQHGSPVSKYKNVLLEIARLLANKKYGPPVGKLIYHIGDEYYDTANIQKQFNRYLSADFPKKLRLEFAIWPKKDLHDRFILTDIGGIDCGIGLDEYAGTSDRAVTFKRLSNTDHSREWSRFKQKTSDVFLP